MPPTLRSSKRHFHLQPALSQKCKMEELLVQAIINGDESQVKLLLGEFKGSKKHLELRDGATLLHLNAQMNGNAAITRHLLNAGCKINAQDIRGETALHKSIYAKNKSVTFYLIEAGANVRLQNTRSQTPLHWAVEFDDAQLVHALISAGACTETRDIAGHTALHSGLIDFKFAAINALLDHGADVNCEDSKGYTPLFLAAFLVEQSDKHANVFKIVRMLLDAGADYNKGFGTLLASGYKVTALEFAIKRNLMTVAKMIVEHAAKLKILQGPRALSQCNREYIKLLPALEAHYKSCYLELKAMKAQKTNNATVSFYGILTNDLQSVVRYCARNKEVVKASEASEYGTSYPIYKDWLKDKFDKIREWQQLIESP